MANNKRIVSCLLVIALLSVSLFSSTQIANAGSDYGASNWAVHYLQVAGEVAAIVALQKLTTTILNKVKNSGPDGTAGFIQNWTNFVTNAQYQGEGIFRAELGKANLCSYFGSNIKSLFGANGSTINVLSQNVRTNNLDPFSIRANCTMPSNFNLTNYQKDFTGNGGWQAFSRMLEPQNNYYGTLFNSLGELGAQRQLAEKANTAKSIANQGFYGFGEKDCKLRVANKCLVPGNIKTPGGVVDKVISDAFGNPSKTLSTSKKDAIVTAAISTLTNWVVSKLFDAGLAGSSADPQDNSSVTSPERTAESYKQEFCMAEDNISKDAGFWVKDNYPQAWSKYPVDQPQCNGSVRLGGLLGYSHSACGKSYCELVRDEFDKNSYPYSRCTESCMKAVSGPPGVGLPPAEFTPGTFEPGVCLNPLVPIPANSLLADLQAERANYGAELNHDEAGKLLNAVAWKNKDAGWGLLLKPSGNNCNQEPGGPSISCDYLVHKTSGLGLDVLIGAPGTADDGTLVPGPSTPTWGDSCPDNPVTDRWLAPVQP